jgi:hypothetical protein
MDDLSMASPQLTVGKLRSFLQSQPADAVITFGSSRWRKRPLVFFRLKLRGATLLQIELNEVELDDEADEIDRRLSVGLFLDLLKGYDAGYAITFGSSLDAVPLEFRDMTSAVAINLEQTQQPKYFVQD